MKFNTAVVKHSTGIKSIPKSFYVSEACAAKEALRVLKIKEKEEALDKELDKIDNDSKKQELLDKVSHKKILDSQYANAFNRVYNQGKEIIFKEFLFEMFSKSLIIDSDMVVKEEDALRHTLESYIDSNGGYKLLSEACKKTNSNYLKRVKDKVKTIAKKVTKRKLKEAKENSENPNTINFSVNSEEKELIDYSKSELNIDELSEKVKSKVLNVIKDEKARQQKEDDLVTELEEKLNELDNEEDNINTNEKNKIKECLNVIESGVVQESTLFNSIFRHSVKELILESGAVLNSQTKEIIKRKKEASKYDTETELHEIIDDSIDENTVEDEKNAQSLNDVKSIDMDLAMVESITKYTMMELFHTIRLENYTPEKLRKISLKLLN